MLAGTKWKLNEHYRVHMCVSLLYCMLAAMFMMAAFCPAAVGHAQSGQQLPVGLKLDSLHAGDT